MKRILTALAIVLVLLLGAAAAAPFWFGMETEKHYQQMIQELAKNTGAAIDNRSYERGWLRSRAEAVIAWPGLPADLTVTHEIAHGPLALDKLLAGELSFAPANAFINSRATFSPSKGASEQEKTLARQLPPVNAETVISLTGDAEMDLTVPPAKKMGKDGSGFNWRGLSGKITVRQGGNQVMTELQSPGLVVARAVSEFSVSQIRLNSDHTATRGVMLGTTTLHIGKVGIGPDIDLKGLRLIASAKPAGPNVDTTVNYQIKELLVNTASYGPGQLTLVLRKLDAAALRRYEQQVNALSRRNLPKEQVDMQTAAETMKLIAALSKKAPELEVTKLSFATPEGELSGAAKIVLDGSELDLAQNMMLIVRALRGELELSIPPSMVKAILTPQIREDIEGYKRAGALSTGEAERITPEVMAKIVDDAYTSYLTRNPLTRWLARSGGQYRLTVSFRDGRLLVNDEPVKQPFFGMPS